MIKLKINTSDSKTVVVGIEINGNLKDEIVTDSKILRSEAVIPSLDKLLRKNNLEFKDISEIFVFEGPGSFTGLRVGASIANALGYLLKIPVNGKKIGEFVEPVYN